MTYEQVWRFNNRSSYNIKSFVRLQETIFHSLVKNGIVLSVLRPITKKKMVGKLLENHQHDFRKKMRARKRN